MIFMQSERRNMKKLLRRAALTAFVFGCMTCAAFAMDADVAVVDSGTSLTPAGGQAITNAEPKTVSDPTSYALSYSDTSVKAGEQYLVLMVAVNDVSNTSPKYTITADNLIYINQTSSTSESVTFKNVYPSGIRDSVILITGGSLTAPKMLAKVDAKGIIGDVEGNGKVNTIDAQTILRYSARMINFTETQLDLGDVDGNGKVNTIDAQTVLRYSARLISSFPRES